MIAALRATLKAFLSDELTTCCVCVRISLLQRVSLVEFEVNNAGMWSRQVAGRRDVRKVKDTLGLLHSAGYSCFWVLTRAMLPASGECWRAEYGGSVAWSNLLCAHEEPVVRALDAIAWKGYEARAAAGGGGGGEGPAGSKTGGGGSGKRGGGGRGLRGGNGVRGSGGGRGIGRGGGGGGRGAGVKRAAARVDAV